MDLEEVAAEIFYEKCGFVQGVYIRRWHFDEVFLFHADIHIWGSAL
jgi:hypothetical protein